MAFAFASEIGAPVLRAAAALRSRGPRTDRSTWKKGLILSHTHIGDVLYRTCSLPMLREFLPQCEWTYAVSPGSADVLAANPHLSDVLPVVHGEDSWNLADGAFEALRAREFDVVLCSNTLRHYPDLALAAALGIPNRFAFSGKGFSGIINHPVAMGFPDTYASYFRNMVAKVVDRPPDWELRPRLHPSARDEERAAHFWRSVGLGEREPVVACSLRSRQAHGNWPDEVVLSVLENARARCSFGVVFTGAQADAAYLEAVASRFRFPAVICGGEGGILTFAAILRRCAALLAIDSGPRHIGNAMGIPVLFARNLSYSMKEAGAYCATEIDLAPPVEYLADDEVDAVTRQQPVGLLADKLIGAISSRVSLA